MYGYGGYLKADYNTNPFYPTDPQEEEGLKSDRHFPTTLEHFYSLNGGIVIKNELWLGIVALYSDQKGFHFPLMPDGLYQMADVHDVWIDFGPEIRLQELNHLMINLAYSHRRGLKSGLGFIF
jgi:hypothetical protein